MAAKLKELFPTKYYPRRYDLNNPTNHNPGPQDAKTGDAEQYAQPMPPIRNEQLRQPANHYSAVATQYRQTHKPNQHSPPAPNRYPLNLPFPYLYAQPPHIGNPNLIASPATQFQVSPPPTYAQVASPQYYNYSIPAQAHHPAHMNSHQAPIPQQRPVRYNQATGHADPRSLNVG